MLEWCRGYDGKLLMGVLPVATFCSGHTFFVQRMAEGLGLEPYVVHATFQFSGTPGKRHRMREAMLWDVVSPVTPAASKPACCPVQPCFWMLAYPLVGLPCRPVCLSVCLSVCRFFGPSACLPASCICSIGK